MSFLDNIKSRMKGDTSAEEQFQRGLREGSWPEGVEDFELMGNTGTFLPATPDADPHQEADAFASKTSSTEDDRADWSVVRAAGSSRAEGRFTVIEGAAGMRPLASSAQAQRPADEDMRVTPRSEGQARERSQAAGAQKSYAERLRERVASADVAPKEEPKMQVKNASRPTGAKPADPVKPEKPAGAAPAPSAPAAPAKPAAARPVSHDEAPTFSSDAVIVRTRTYDDVRKIASGLLSDHRPVVLAMRGTSDAACQRILDFSFGMCCASGATMRELGQKLYAICPKGVTVSDATMAELKRQGILR